MNDPIVNIIADGRLAYTGPLSAAARRQRLREDILVRCIEHGLQLIQEPTFYETAEGRFLPRPRANS